MSKRELALAGLVVALVLLFSINLFAGGALRSARLDLTENRLYTLSDGTRNILRDMDEKVTLRFFFSKKLATDFTDLKGYAQRVQELLEEYVSESNGKLTLHVIDPEPFSEEEDQAVGYGLQGIPINSAGEVVYFGLAGTNTVDDEEAVPFFQVRRETFLEYDLTKLIYNLSHPQKQVVGLLSSLPIDGGPFNPMNPQQAPQPWLVVDQIKQLFEVRKVAPTATELPDDIDILLLVHPQDLDPGLLYSIDQFALGGGKVLAFLDEHCEAQQVPQNPQNPMQAAMANRKSDLGPLMAAWGVERVNEKVVGDRQNAQRVGWANGVVDYVVWLGLKEDAFAEDDPVTSELKQVNLGTAGVLRPIEGATTTFTTLMHSSAGAMQVDRMKVAIPPPNPPGLLDEYVPGDEELTIAARLSGPVKSAWPDGPPKDEAAADDGEEPAPSAADHRSEGTLQAIVVSDADLLEDKWWVQVSNFFGNRIGIPSANNADFVINCLDNLSGSEDLISLRSRGKFNRPFDRVTEIRRAAEERYRQEEEDLEAKLRETETKISQLQTQQDGAAGALILGPEERAAIEKFREERLETRKKLRDVKHELRKEIESLGTWLKAINIGIYPAAIGVLAFAVGAFRHRRRS